VTDPLPSNVQAEEALLGSVLIDPSLIWEIAALVEPNDFYIHRNRFIWMAMLVLTEKKITVDYVTLCQELDKRGTLSEIGGGSYLAGLVNAVPTSLHAKDYASIVREMADRRAAIQAASRIAKTAFDLEADFLSTATDELGMIANRISAEEHTVHISQAVSELYDEVEERYREPQDIFGLPTGLIDVDRLTGGIETGMHFLGGLPGIGKSKLAKQLGVSWARSGHAGIIFSMEMSRKMISRRIVSAEAEVATQLLKSGRLEDDDWVALTHAIGNLSELPLYICTLPDMTPAQFRSILTKYKQQHDIRWYVLDYLLLMGGQTSRQNDTEWSQYLSRSVKSITTGMDLVGITISSVTKEGMGKGIPNLKDLRGSGQLPHDADIVMILTDHMPESGTIANSNVNTLWFLKTRDMPGGTNQRVELLAEKNYPLFRSVETRAIIPDYNWQGRKDIG